ncbi:PIN domain-containing protein [Candidatus Poribacteria bacterium]|nr:PIN domain-containing protein [Candidatus Poribacteria bacterium]
MRNSVFIDASAWIGIIDENDRRYEIAQRTYNELLANKTPLTTINWTVYEAISLVKGRRGYSQAYTLWERITTSRLVTLVRITEDIEAAALNIFWRYRDKIWGVVDCASLVVMERMDCEAAFAFDGHFKESSRQYGFQVIP